MNIKIIGKYEEALDFYKEALDGNRSVLGNSHPDTLVTINNMGVILNNQGKLIPLICLYVNLFFSLIFYCYVHYLSILQKENIRRLRYIIRKLWMWGDLY